MNLPIAEALTVFEGLELTIARALIASGSCKRDPRPPAVPQRRRRRLPHAGRRRATLSGGEGQRIRLATQIGSNLTGVLYVLDEPSIGLHQRDNRALLGTLARLRDLGNTVVVVEHDEETIRTADYVIDLGPWRGRARRRVIFQGTPATCSPPAMGR